MHLAHAFRISFVCLVGAAHVAGAQWIPQQSSVDVELRGLSVVSPSVVWASGQRGTVLRSVDGGEHWTSHTIPGADSLDLRAISATSATVAHALSIADSSRIYRTTDGGQTWTRRWSATRKGTFLDALRFWDARHGIAMSDPVDGRFLVLTTSDGGDTWQEVPADRIPAAMPNEGGFAASGSCIATFGSSHVWIVSGGATAARIYHSADRGRTWSVHDTAGAFSVAFRDAQHGAIAGGDYAKPRLAGRNVAVTSDGGATWTLTDSTSSPSGYRSAIAFVPATRANTLVAVGLTGTDVSLDGGRSWRGVDSTAYNSVVFASPSAGWTVGPKGRIARWRGAAPDSARAAVRR